MSVPSVGSVVFVCVCVYMCGWLLSSVVSPLLTLLPNCYLCKKCRFVEIVANAPKIDCIEFYPLFSIVLLFSLKNAVTAL